MNYENKHRIESLAKAACPNSKKVSVILRSRENSLSDRPNAFIVTIGKKGYTSVRQSSYYPVDTVNSRKDYSDQELAQILDTITKDPGSLRFFDHQDAKLVNYKGEEVEAKYFSYICSTNKRTMKRYYYELMDEDYNSYEVAIPDGRIKARAIAQAKRAMRDLGIRRALLEVNSMRTSDILDIITVELD